MSAAAQNANAGKIGALHARNTGKKYLSVSGLVLASALLVTSAPAQENTIVALGDSNTAGFGVGPQQAFPARLAEKLRAQGQPVQVVNAGVTRDTLEGMLSRVDTSVPQGTRLVIVQGGYNDLVNRVPPDVTAASLEGILARLRARHVKAVVCGFFDRNWDAIGRKLSARYGATFVSGSTCYDPNHAGPDGLHMSAEGHEVVAGRLARVVQPGSRHQ
ncbi:MAG TPA: GDSL-type esterase/lipase family protein [Xanthobacteraceae bacterium]|nr:GDSL-type esterase/lipase family protein [Xanthobacteraceae bacterium]